MSNTQDSQTLPENPSFNVDQSGYDMKAVSSVIGDLQAQISVSNIEMKNLQEMQNTQIDHLYKNNYQNL